MGEKPNEHKQRLKKLQYPAADSSATFTEFMDFQIMGFGFHWSVPVLLLA
jgi:hypothetical protein